PNVPMVDANPNAAIIEPISPRNGAPRVNRTFGGSRNPTDASVKQTDARGATRPGGRILTENLVGPSKAPVPKSTWNKYSMIVRLLTMKTGPAATMMSQRGPLSANVNKAMPLSRKLAAVFFTMNGRFGRTWTRTNMCVAQPISTLVPRIM